MKDINSDKVQQVITQAKEMYKYVDKDINEACREYFLELEKIQNQLEMITIHFSDKLHKMNKYNLDQDLKKEQINVDSLNLEKKNPDELIAIFNAIEHYSFLGDIIENTINNVIPTIIRYLDMSTNENSVINYLYANLYSTLSEKEINDIFKFIKEDSFQIDTSSDEIKKSNIYEYEFIPYKKIGNILLDKVDDKNFQPNGVSFLQELAFNDVLCRAIAIDSPESKKRGLEKYVYIIYNNQKIQLTCIFDNFIDNLSKICDDIIIIEDDKNINDKWKYAYSKKLGIIIGADLFKGQTEYYIQSIRFVGKENFDYIVNKINNKYSYEKENYFDFGVNDYDDIEKLKRKNIADKLYEYRKNNDGNLDIKSYANGFVEIVESYILKSTFETNNDFLMVGRKKFLFDEFYDYLEHKEKHKLENPVRFAIGNVEEFICNPNFVNMSDVDKSKWKDGKIIDGKDFAELRDTNDRYSVTGIICLEEKEYIEKMINRLKE